MQLSEMTKHHHQTYMWSLVAIAERKEWEVSTISLPNLGTCLAILHPIIFAFEYTNIKMWVPSIKPDTSHRHPATEYINFAVCTHISCEIWAWELISQFNHFWKYELEELNEILCFLECPYQWTLVKTSMPRICMWINMWEMGTLQPISCNQSHPSQELVYPCQGVRSLTTAESSLFLLFSHFLPESQLWHSFLPLLYCIVSSSFVLYQHNLILSGQFPFSLLP